MRIYTKFGDRGETRLFDGTRVPKSNIRVAAYGNVDELASVLGAAAAFIEDEPICGVLNDIQRQLLTLGAQLANPTSDNIDTAQGGNPDRARLAKESVANMEAWIDGYEAELPELQKFILSGGGPAGAMVHLARTVCRRAERGVVSLGQETSLDPLIIEYLNRLSDFLFVLARTVNHREGIKEIQW